MSDKFKIGDIVYIESGYAYNKTKSIKKIDRETKTMFIAGAYRIYKKYLTLVGKRGSIVRLVEQKDYDYFTRLERIRKLKKYDYSKIYNINLERIDAIITMCERTKE